MNNFRDYINESSLSRVWKGTKEHDSGTITAFRDRRDCNEGEPFTKSENEKRNGILRAKLLKLGYGVTKIKGTYIENYNTPKAKEVKEDSYLVLDLEDKGNLQKDLVKLGQEFEQDSITFQNHETGDYYLISSNKCKLGYPGEGKVNVKVKLGKSIFGKSGEFHSKVNGRPFVFESINNNIQKFSDFGPTSIRSINEFAKKEV